MITSVVTAEPLRIFVAMPGTDMGPNASYKHPELVKQNLLQPVADKLKARLGRDVLLIIEKDKRQSGPIHESMFGEASDAEVYIADLTGANPNVYLELGVRWALRDRVTVPIAQRTEDLRFNVGANRAILYGPDNIIKAIDDIATAIESGLKTDQCDSPVRSKAAFIQVPQKQIDEMNAEIARLRSARGEDLVRAAMATDRVDDRIRLLEQAVASSPAYVEAWVALGRSYRDRARYPEAIEALRSARALSPDEATVARELGVTYSKNNDPAAAAGALRDAVTLAPNDSEAWSNLGGALRRLAMSQGAAHADKLLLEEARQSYARANEINKYDLYSGLNVARLDVLLSKWDPARMKDAQASFQKQLHLSRFAVEEAPNDYWRAFDLAETLLFSGESDAAIAQFRKAIGMVPAQERADKLASVASPLRNALSLNVLPDALKSRVEQIDHELAASAAT